MNMIKGIVRLAGFLMVAAGFAFAVVDGATSIAANALRYTVLRETLAAALPRQFPGLEALVTKNVHPLLWDPMLVTVFRVPTAIALVVLGMLVLFLMRHRAVSVGTPTRR
jgi:hypothetical protein